MSQPDDQDRTRFDELRQWFGDRLVERVGEIEAAWEAAQTASGGGEALARLHRLAHSLAGTAGTFGYPDVGLAARVLEKRLEELLGSVPTSSELGALGSLLVTLREAAAPR
jgi:HPt (histidine-containing phosphotransfer) domain-containing protein